MTTDCRAELQRLVEAYDDHGGNWPEDDVEAFRQAVERARATLSQPEPEGPPLEPTDEEILDLSEEHDVSYTTPGGVVINPYQDGVDVKDDVLSFARAVLARWGRPVIEPVPVSLKKQALKVLEDVPGPDHLRAMTVLDAGQHALIRRALEALPDGQA